MSDFKNIKIKSKEMVSKMTLKEKASLCSGEDFWMMKGIERLDLPGLMMTDGPHGLRKQEGATDNLGINESGPSTCYPPACTTACSFDENLMEEIGAALAKECRQAGVSVLLGPGMNIKRTPLCGRNFEYISEDPYLTGKMATAIVKGMQENGLGASLKHFAANNQELYRMTGNSIIDERALREIYLRGFEMVVKEQQPWTVMCSYNRLNGIYACENKWLLNDILREKWGYDGVVVSDWGATNDRVEALDAGMELEMPNSGNYYDKKIAKAVRKKQLPEAVLNKAAERLVELILKGKANISNEKQEQKQEQYFDEFHKLAKKAADASMVLLKNDGILPWKKHSSAAVIGQFAKTTRYQGAGSSRINPTKLDNAFDKLTELGMDFDYADGYSMNDQKLDTARIEEACKIAKNKDVVIIFAGLPEQYESESYDRADMNMPESHSLLIEEVCKVNKNIVVVLQLGSPAVLPWRNKVRAILLTYLSGQAGGSSMADILTGSVNPSGKLAETWPIEQNDVSCANYYPGDCRNVEYRESIFVGYRYYQKAQKEVAYCFGHGLSYTKFEYLDLAVKTDENGRAEASFTIKNNGEIAGAEITQIYVGIKNSALPRAKAELRGFKKVFLEKGESKSVKILLDERSFSYFNTKIGGWAVEAGEYSVCMAASADDVRGEVCIKLDGDGKEKLLAGLKQAAPIYFNLPKQSLIVSESEFEAVFGGVLPRVLSPEKKHFTVNSTLNDIRLTKMGKIVYGLVEKHSDSFLNQNREDIKNMVEMSMYDMPLRAFSLCSCGVFTPVQLDGLVELLNGKVFKGLSTIILGINRETISFLKKFVFKK